MSTLKPIPELVDEDLRLSELTTKFCHECGNTSKRYRRGPDGPQTLCNKCGLRYYRKMRRIKKDTKAQVKFVAGPSTRQINEQRANLQQQMFNCYNYVNWIVNQRLQQAAIYPPPFTVTQSIQMQPIPLPPLPPPVSEITPSDKPGYVRITLPFEY